MAINVRILRGVQTGLTGMSGLVALSGGAAACTGEAPPRGESLGCTSSAVTVQDAGTGVFSLAMAYGYQVAFHWEFSAKNSTDEYVRVGEKMSFDLPANLLWEVIHHADATPRPDVARLKQLSAVVTVFFVDSAGVSSQASVATNGSFSGSQTYDLTLPTSAFVIPAKTSGLRFEIRVNDAQDSERVGRKPSSEFNEVRVVGGNVPTKTLLFDTDYARFRQRILEGGKPVSGAELAIAYTDWRAKALVDSSSIDAVIGTQTSYGRFGSFQRPIQGDLVYEITYAAGVDGAWQAERPLTANGQSPWLPSSGPSGQVPHSERTAYEGLLQLPAGASRLELYFHVKTYLDVNYDKFTDVNSRRYENGARFLVREKWDNENGAYADNYGFGIEVP